MAEMGNEERDMAAHVRGRQVFRCRNSGVAGSSGAAWRNDQSPVQKKKEDDCLSMMV